MIAEQGIEYESALRFFGKMSASISHEINNTLAIINENAGLLEDFALMADKGRAIDPARLKTIAEKILIQIHRADSIIKNMNKFAHSVDERVRSVDMNDLLQLMIELSSRFASMRGVTIELKRPAEPLFITTNIFFLENLLWQFLDFAMDITGQGKTVFLNTDITENHILIRFSQLEGLKSAPRNTPQVTMTEGLLDALKGTLTTNIEAGMITLTLPKDINR